MRSPRCAKESRLPADDSVDAVDSPSKDRRPSGHYGPRRPRSAIAATGGRALRGERVGQPDQFEAQRAQALAGVRVIGLAVGARFTKPVEIEAAAAFERARLDELQDRRAALLDCAERPRAG